MKNSNSLSLAALICGVVAIILCFIPIQGGLALFVVITALALGITAIVLGAKGMKNAKVTGEGRGMAIAGLVTGIIATSLCGLCVLCVACAIAGIGLLYGAANAAASAVVVIIAL